MGTNSAQLSEGAIVSSQQHSYKIDATLGMGGFGLTYVASVLDSGQPVAIKEFYPLRCQVQRSTDGYVTPGTNMAQVYYEGMRSFLAEATMLQAFGRVTSVVCVHDYFEANGTAYMVMEYLEGTTLRDCVCQRGNFAPDEILPPMEVLMGDVDVLHRGGVLHRDIAPDNIMLMPDGSLKLIDFGCARAMEDGKSMEVLLKPGFAPIEQYGKHGQNTYTDVYALCATIYYCLSGEVPPESPRRAMAVVEGLPDPLKILSSMGVEVSRQTERAILRGMAIQPQDRFQTMGELKQALVEKPKEVVTPEPPPMPVVTENVEQRSASVWEEYWLTMLVGLLVLGEFIIVLVRIG